MSVAPKVDYSDDSLVVPVCSASDPLLPAPLLPAPLLPAPLLPAPSPAAYVIVCDKEAGTPVELPLSSTGALKVQTLQIEFTGATGIKYRNPSTNIYRILAPDECDLIYPPLEGWSNYHYVACAPKSAEEQPWLSNGNGAPPSKIARVESNFDYQDTPTPFNPRDKYANHEYDNARNPTVPLNPYPPPFRGGFGRSRGEFGPRQRGNFGGRGRGRGSFNGPPKEPPNPVAIEAAAKAGSAMAPTSIIDFCDVCKVALNSQYQSDEHFKGKRHLEMANKPERGRGRGRARGTFGRGRGRGPPGQGSNRGALLNSATAKSVFDYSDDNIGVAAQKSSGYGGIKATQF